MACLILCPTLGAMHGFALYPSRPSLGKIYLKRNGMCRHAYYTYSCFCHMEGVKLEVIKSEWWKFIFGNFLRY